MAVLADLKHLLIEAKQKLPPFLASVQTEHDQLNEDLAIVSSVPGPVCHSQLCLDQCRPRDPSSFTTSNRLHHVGQRGHTPWYKLHTSNSIHSYSYCFKVLMVSLQSYATVSHSTVCGRIIGSSSSPTSYSSLSCWSPSSSSSSRASYPRGLLQSCYSFLWLLVSS